MNRQRAKRPTKLEPYAPIRRHWVAVCLAVALAAVVMGAPSLRGGFLGGDDVQLARDHVYVNRPSLEHAAKLFAMFHRDLYQPVAMLSLSGDFAIVKLLGLTPTKANEIPGAWVFHLTNVILHSICAVLVCVLLRRMTGSVAIAGVCAGLFALHPINAETIAWLSGRMMLLSTAFLLAGVVVFDAWAEKGRWWRLALAMLFIALCMMSKVRISAPVLLLVPMLFRGQWPPRRWWIAWAGVAAMTALFVGVNYLASSSMFAGGVAYLQGSRLARTAIALGWYFTHIVVPVGFSPYHATPQTLTWSYPGTIRALVVVLCVLGATILAARRARFAWTGMLWFLASIAVTLPLLPMRNLAVAERYAYVPAIGLFWILTIGGTRLYGALRDRISRSAARTAGALLASALAVTLCAISWHTIGYFRDDVSRTGRMVELYADHAGTGVRHGWSLHNAGRYEEAIAAARSDQARFGEEVDSDAWQVIGMSYCRMGRVDECLEALRRAIEADEKDAQAHSRLGSVLRELGRNDEATAAYERATELSPGNNPALIALAELYRQAGRSDDARKVYEQVLVNNPFDAFAPLGLAELDIAVGRYAEALERLLTLLDWMPDNVPARINAGLSYSKLGDMQAALNQYEAALAIEPDAPIAVVNLANLQIELGNALLALDLFSSHLAGHPADRVVLNTACDFLITQRDFRSAAELMVRAIEHEPGAADLRGRYAWLSCLVGQWDVAGQEAARALQADPRETYARFAVAAVSLVGSDSEAAVRTVRGLMDEGTLSEAVKFDALCAALQTYAQANDADPWPYYLVGMACVATDRPEAARLAADEFKARTSDPALHARMDRVLDGD
jgi:tetratricopeptide (TPR) repeat protein